MCRLTVLWKARIRNWITLQASLPKIVFSKTLKEVDWNNSRLVKDVIAEEILQLKNQPSRDLALFGSADLASTFIKLNLIDEYRIFITPFVLGEGSPTFENIKERIPLKLLKTSTWSSGTVVLHYERSK